jgi:hypothetical protein
VFSQAAQVNRSISLVSEDFLIRCYVYEVIGDSVRSYGEITRDFSKELAKFKLLPSVKQVRVLQSLAVRHENLAEILVADRASFVANDRLHLFKIIAEYSSKDSRCRAIASCAVEALRRFNERVIPGLSADRVGYYRELPVLKLRAEDLLEAPSWAKAIYMSLGWGRPDYLRNLARLSEKLVEERPASYTAYLYLAFSLKQNVSVGTGNGSLRFIYSKEEFARNRELAAKAYERALQLNPSCDIAMYRVGCKLYLTDKARGRELICRAIELLKKRPAASQYLKAAKEFLDRNP